MQSTIAICNVALTSYIGTKTITSLQETSPEAEQCALHYDRVRRSLLQRWPWHWAASRDVLALEALNDKAGAWSYRYARPAHMIALRWVNSPLAVRASIANGRPLDTPRETTATSIYSDVQHAVCEFTRDEEDASLFPPAFADVLAAYLAAAIAMPITRDAAKVKAAQEDAADLLNVAMTLDFNTAPSAAQTNVPQHLAVRGII